MNATGTMLIDLVLLFFIYSLTGWCIEVCLKYIQYQGCCKVEPHSFISHPQIVLFSLFFQSRRNVNRDWLFFLQSKALGIATSM